MSLSKDKSIVRRFDAAAETYEAAADIQRVAAQHLLERLTSDDTPRAILELGCGTGLLTDGLASRFPDVPITAVDVAPGMIRVASRDHARVQSIKWVCVDAREAVFDSTFDLVVSASASPGKIQGEFISVQPLGRKRSEKDILLPS